MRLLISTGHPVIPERYGGSSRSIADLQELLPAFGVTVGVLAKTNADRASRDGDVFRAPEPADAVDRAVAEFRPDIVLLQTGAIVPILLALEPHDVALAVYLRNAELRDKGGVLFPHPRIVYLANSGFTQTRFRIARGIESTVLPPIVPWERYRTETSRERVLFVNPVTTKGAETAFRLAEARPDIPFTFVAGWPTENEWRTYCRDRAAAAGNIEWHETIDDMRPLYARARLLLAPSLWEEAWCRCVSEAQASGIPALASARGGLPENVGAAGTLVETGAGIDAWLAALDRLWHDEAHYERCAAAARAIAARPDRAPDAMAARFVDLLRRHTDAHAAL